MRSTALAITLLVCLPAFANVSPVSIDGEAGLVPFGSYLNDFGAVSAPSNDFVSATNDGGVPVIYASGTALNPHALISLHFYGQVVGPTGGASGGVTQIPLVLSGSVSAFSSADHVALAFIDLSQGTSSARLSACSGTFPCGNGGGLTELSGAVGLDVSVGTQFDVWMYSSVAYGTQPLETFGVLNFATAFRPSVFIDPNFAGASLYRVEFSAGIDVSPVPEVSPAAMLSLGLCGLLLARRRSASRAPMA